MNYSIEKGNEPQINAPSRASGGRIHVCPQAYVSMHSGGHDADERRFVHHHHGDPETLRRISKYSPCLCVSVVKNSLGRDAL